MHTAVACRPRHNWLNESGSDGFPRAYEAEEAVEEDARLVVKEEGEEEGEEEEDV